MESRKKIVVVDGLEFTIGIEPKCDFSVEDCDALMRSVRLWNETHPMSKVTRLPLSFVRALVLAKRIFGGRIVYS